MELKYEDILSKILLIGITYYTHDKEFIDQKQLWGTVIVANENELTIKQNNGILFSLPPVLESIEKAAPGEYTLRSTGKVIVDPDYLTTWSVYRPEESKADDPDIRS